MSDLPVLASQEVTNDFGRLSEMPDVVSRRTSNLATSKASARSLYSSLTILYDATMRRIVGSGSACWTSIYFTFGQTLARSNPTASRLASSSMYVVSGRHIALTSKLTDLPMPFCFSLPTAIGESED